MKLAPTLAVALLAVTLVACGDDAEPKVGSNNTTANNTAVNNTAVNNTAVNNTAVNNTAINNTAVNNTAPNNTAPNNAQPSACTPPPSEPQLGLTESVPPRGYEGLEGVTFYQGVEYGPFDLNAFDIFVPASESPTPLIIYIHGGGFTAGQRESGYTDVERTTRLLNEGIAYASISYRLLEAQETEGVIKSMSDSRRAVQFIRHHAADFNIDPDRIGLAGGSAGAGTAMWIGLADESCDTANADPVLQTSTRVQAIAALETQGTYDLKRWETDVYAEDYPLVTLENLVGFSPSFYALIGQFYGLPVGWMNLADLEEEPLVSYRAQVDMFAMVDATDPPLYLSNAGPQSMPAGLDSLLHHPLHAQKMYDFATAAGMERVEIRTQEFQDGTSQTFADFMIDVLAP
jgi:acetyl esterase/lipase